MTKRRALLVAVLGVGLVGLALATVPLIGSLAPSAATGRPFLDVALRDIEPGQFKLVEWQGRPVAVVRTTPEMLKDLRAHTEKTLSHRTLPEEAVPAFVVHLASPKNCLLKHAPKGSDFFSGREWPGGFYDPCHFGEWDYAGRTLDLVKNLPKEMQLADLTAPKYEILANETVRLLH